MCMYVFAVQHHSSVSFVLLCMNRMLIFEQGPEYSASLWTAELQTKRQELEEPIFLPKPTDRKTDERKWR